mmetsp:Transcript_57885/g.183596  ORF Transcript_57885/g.183596 Transcript_57885/m.183596 type:complete len:91 (+) Transcript_57885:668-940(+)
MPLLGEDGAPKRSIEDRGMTVDSESERLKMLEEEDRRARVKEYMSFRLDRLKARLSAKEEGTMGDLGDAPPPAPPPPAPPRPERTRPLGC